MSSSIIQVENLSKSFTLHHEGAERYTALRDVVAAKAKKIFSLPKSFNIQHSSPNTETFWALKDVSFNIEQGDRVGIIGRNGAGKSTLLKILSRITEPTKGSIKIRGRVASLLEVGTGFHPELTGRENIYLNGAILGMSRAEIRKKFEEIVEFAEVEKFLDTPVKRYSSGMYVRLAFAVAAHLEPEILVVDEVLAVGDAQFQKKCLGKMEEVSKNEGRTIVFVSHQLNTVSTLCNKGVLLQKGMLKNIGEIDQVISCYLQSNLSKKSEYCPLENNSIGGVVRPVRIYISDKEGTIRDSYRSNETIIINMEYEVIEEGHILWQGHNIYNSQNINVFDTHNVDSPYYNVPHPKGIFCSRAIISSNLLAEDIYLISNAIFNHNRGIIHFHIKESVLFSVYDDYEAGIIARGESKGNFPGIIRPLLKWEIQTL